MLFFLNCLYEAVEEEYNILRRKQEEYNQFLDMIDKLNLKLRDKDLLKYLGQAELFGDDGLSKEELACSLNCSIQTVNILVKKYFK